MGNKTLHTLFLSGWTIADVCFASGLSRYKIKKYMSGGDLAYLDLYALEIFFNKQRKNGEKWLQTVRLNRLENGKKTNYPIVSNL